MIISMTAHAALVASALGDKTMWLTEDKNSDIGQFHKKVNYEVEIVFDRLVVPLFTAIGTGSPRYLLWVLGLWI